MDTTLNLNRRYLALLGAVATGSVQLTCSSHPDLLVDGRWCSDHTAATDLIRAGLLARAEGPIGSLVPAALTSSGQALLATAA